MAVTGKFLADFESFYAAVQKAEVELRGMETGAGKVGGALNRMVDGFSGRKLIQDATLSAEAVERIGGTSKLTAAELQRVAGQAAEAAAKMRALGVDVPPAIAKIAAEAKSAGGALSELKGIAGSLAGALGIGLSIGAVVNFGKSVFDAASKIGDLSDRLGISAEAVQGFKFAAEQGGSSLDTVGAAITKMNASLSEGDKGTVKALKALGLSFHDIRDMKPEEAFLAITDQIRKIPDPMEQTNVALKLFGKNGAELLPAIKDGFREVASSSDKMSTETIRALKDAEDAWGRLSDKVVIASGTIISHAMSAAKGATSSWQHFATFVANSVKFGAGVAATMADVTAAAQDAAAAAAAQPPSAPNKPPKPPRRTQEEEEQILRHAKAIKELMDAFSGQAAIKQANDAVEAFNRNLMAGITPTMMTAEQTKKLHDVTTDAMDAYKALGKEAPDALKFVHLHTIDLTEKAIPLTRGLADALRDVGVQAEIAEPKFIPLTTGAEAFLKTLEGVGTKADFFNKPLKKVVDLKHGIGDLSQAMAELAQISGDAFGGIVRDMSTLVGSLNTGVKALSAFKDGQKAMKDGSMLAGISSMSSGILGIASAALQAGKAIKNMFFGTAGRDAVKDFAAQFQVFNLDTMQFNPGGGFNELHAELSMLGAEGERLWKALTQGVGRNNPEQARAVIDLINKALAAHKQAINEAADAAGSLGDAETQAMNDAKAAIEQMDDELKSLFDSIKDEAPEEVMGVVEAQTRARIEAIQRERDAAQAAMDDTVGNAAKAAKEAGDIIDQALKEREFVIRVRAELDGLPGGAGGIVARNQQHTPTEIEFGPIEMDGQRVTETISRRLVA